MISRKRKDGIVAKRLRGKYGPGTLSDLLDREVKETSFTLNQEECSALSGSGIEVETNEGTLVFDIPSDRICNYMNVSRQCISFHAKRMGIMREYMYYQGQIVFNKNGFLYFKLLKELNDETLRKKNHRLVTRTEGNRIIVRTRKNRSG